MGDLRDTLSSLAIGVKQLLFYCYFLIFWLLCSVLVAELLGSLYKVDAFCKYCFVEYFSDSYSVHIVTLLLMK